MLLRFQLISASLLMLATALGCDARGDADIEQGMKHWQKQEYEAAIAAYETGLPKSRKEYDDSVVHTLIGNCHSELGDQKKAIQSHKRSLKANPKNHQAMVNMGVAYRLLGDYGQAANCYRSALEIAPDYPELHSSLGTLAIFQGEPEKAIPHFERANAIDDTLPTTHGNLAVAYAMVGRFDDAERSLERAIGLHYKNVDWVRRRIDEIRLEQTEAELGIGEPSENAPK